MRTRAKICGITQTSDIQAAVEAGADAIGLVFYAPSPRNVTFYILFSNILPDALFRVSFVGVCA